MFEPEGNAATVAAEKKKRTRERGLWIALVIFLGAGVVALAVTTSVFTTDSANVSRRLALTQEELEVIADELITCTSALENCSATENCTATTTTTPGATTTTTTTNPVTTTTTTTTLTTADTTTAVVTTTNPVSATTTTTTAATCPTTVPATTPVPPPPFIITCNPYSGYVSDTDFGTPFNVSGLTCMPYTTTITSSNSTVSKRADERTDEDPGLSWLPDNNRTFGEDVFNTPPTSVEFNVPAEIIPSPESIEKRRGIIEDPSGNFGIFGTDPINITTNNYTTSSVAGGDIYKISVQSNDLFVHVFNASTLELAMTLNLSSFFPAQCLTTEVHLISCNFDWRAKRFYIGGVTNFTNTTTNVTGIGFCMAVSTDETSFVFNTYVIIPSSGFGSNGFAVQDASVFISYQTVTILTQFWFPSFMANGTVAFELIISRPDLLNAVPSPRTRTASGTLGPGPCRGIDIGKNADTGTFFRKWVFLVCFHPNGVMGFEINSVSVNSTSPDGWVGPGITDVGFRVDLAQFNFAASQSGCLPGTYSTRPARCVSINGTLVNTQPFKTLVSYYNDPIRELVAFGVTAVDPVTGFMTVLWEELYFEQFMNLTCINGRNGRLTCAGGQNLINVWRGGGDIYAPAFAYDGLGNLFMAGLDSNLNTVVTYKMYNQTDFVLPTILAPSIGSLQTQGLAGTSMFEDAHYTVVIGQYISSSTQLYRARIGNVTYEIVYTAVDSCNVSASCTRQIRLTI